jgi:hypothetical protein
MHALLLVEAEAESYSRKEYGRERGPEWLLVNTLGIR